MTTAKPQKPKLVTKVKQLMHRIPAHDWEIIRDWLNNNLKTKRQRDHTDGIKRVGAGHKVVIALGSSQPVGLHNKICTVIRYGPKNVTLEMDDTKQKYHIPYGWLRPLTEMVLERAGGKQAGGQAT